MKRLTLLLLCCLWLVSEVVFAQNLVTTGIVGGHVSDTLAQLPIEGVRVVIVSDDGSETTVETDGNGEFEIGGLAPGRYLLNSYKDGYWDCVGEPVTVVAGGNHQVSLKTAEYAKTGAVRGYISDTSTAQLPIKGVLVVIVGTNGTESEAISDNTGEFKIAGIPPGRYLLSIYKEGYGDRTSKPVTVVAGGEHYVPLKMTKKEPPWLLLICLGVAAVLIVGIAIVAGLRTDQLSD